MTEAEPAGAASRPEEVAPGVWLIALPLPFPVASINVYLVRQDGGYLLIDCGLKTRACRQGLAEALRSLGVDWTKIRRLVITHLHPDHFGLAAEVRRLSGAAVLMHPAETALMTPRYLDNDLFARHSAWLKENGVPPDETQEIARASAGIVEFVEMVEVDAALQDGERLAIEGGTLQAVWTPGHSPGLLTLYFAERRLYFSSDHIIEKITPNIGLHTHSGENPLGDYLASLERVRRLDIELVLPSHGRPFGEHRAWIDATIRHHRERCERMLAAVAVAPLTACQVVAAEWGEHLSPLNQRFAVAEALAHLEYLRRAGRAAPRRDNGVYRWSKLP